MVVSKNSRKVQPMRCLIYNLHLMLILQQGRYLLPEQKQTEIIFTLQGGMAPRFINSIFLEIIFLHSLYRELPVFVIWLMTVPIFMVAQQQTEFTRWILLQKHL